MSVSACYKCSQCAIVFVHRSLIYNDNLFFFSHFVNIYAALTHLLNKRNALTDYRLMILRKKVCAILSTSWNVIFTTMLSTVLLCVLWKAKKMCLYRIERIWHCCSFVAIITIDIAALVSMPSWQCIEPFCCDRMQKNSLTALSSSQTDAVWSNARFKWATIWCVQMKFIRLAKQMGVLIHARHTHRWCKKNAIWDFSLINIIILKKNQHTQKFE